MNLLYKKKKLEEGYNFIVGRKNSNLKLLEFGRIILTKGGKYRGETKNNEEVLDIFSGICDIEIESIVDRDVIFNKVGGRIDVFSGKANCLYMPYKSRYTIKCISDKLDIGVFKSPCRRDTIIRLLKPDEIEIKNVGRLNWKRGVCTTIGENVDADRLIVGETYSYSGNWSSYPPHKHDTCNPPSEAPYEEIYYFMIKPSCGFGIQRVYTDKNIKDSIDEVYVIEDQDTVVIPKGYHPVAVSPGYSLAYYWALAGNERKYAAWSDDPKHSWVRNCEAILSS